MAVVHKRMKGKALFDDKLGFVSVPEAPECCRSTHGFRHDKYKMTDVDTEVTCKRCSRLIRISSS